MVLTRNNLDCWAVVILNELHVNFEPPRLPAPVGNLEIPIPEMVMNLNRLNPSIHDDIPETAHEKRKIEAKLAFKILPSLSIANFCSISNVVHYTDKR